MYAVDLFHWYLSEEEAKMALQGSTMQLKADTPPHRQPGKMHIPSLSQP